ncbi:MAG: hypothetical protein WB555_07235 [Candidatus Korobacteraceae bacterium]
MDREIKMGLEAEARLQGLGLAEFLDRMALHIIEDGRRRRDINDEIEQARLHAAVAKCIGTVSGGGRHDSENVRALVRKRLKERYAR